MGDWKLLGNPRDVTKKAPLSKNDKHFLSNLSTHKNELKNLADEHPDVVERLKRRHANWLAGISKNQ